MPGIYWLAVVLISVVGTLFSDNLVDNLGVELQTTTIAFSVILACVFARLVLERADALGPHHRHHPSRGLLLAGDPLHLRPRHLGRRSRRREARTRLPAVGRDLRRGDRDRHLRPLPLQAERDPRLLDRLHPHPPARRLDRRLPLPADRRNRPRPGDDPDQRHLPQHDPRPGRLPDDLQARPDRGLQRGGPAGRRVRPDAPRATGEPGSSSSPTRPRRRRRWSTRCASAPLPARRRFFVLVPNPDHLPFDRNSTDTSDGEKVLERALPRLQEPSRGRRSRAGSPTAPTPTTTSSRS